MLDGLYADPDLVNFGGTFYLYPTTDGYKDWQELNFRYFHRRMDIILPGEKAGDSLGTGHHSIVKIPGEDQYLIAYHRFGTPVKKYLDGKGFNREVCVEKLEFGEDGKMKKV